jgi:hypothetical protein
MSVIAGYLILSIVSTLLLTLTRLTSWRPWSKKGIDLLDLIPVAFKSQFHQDVKPSVEPNEGDIKDILDLADYHETAARLADLIKRDGAGTWPPRVNLTWPAVLRPYMDIYNEMAPLLPAATVSLDDEVNRERIDNFRSRFSKLLGERVNLPEVTHLLEAADAGRWDVFPRDAYNAFYGCIAWCRHAYR